MARSYIKLLNWLAMGTAQVLPRHIPLLAHALGDADPKVRRRALRLIEKAGPIALRALPYVVKLLGDRDKAVRATAAWCLAGLGQGARINLLAPREYPPSPKRTQLPGLFTWSVLAGVSMLSCWP